MSDRQQQSDLQGGGSRGGQARRGGAGAGGRTQEANGLTMQPKKCEACGAPADWGVADLHDGAIERVEGQLITLLVVSTVHWWCDAHTRGGFRYTRTGSRVTMR